MKNQYWTLCDKSEDCSSKCPYAEHREYQRRGCIVYDQYICFLPDMEDCPYYQKQQYEKTSAPAQLMFDLEYDEKPKRGKRAELPLYDDYADWSDKRCRVNQLGKKCEAYEEV